MSLENGTRRLLVANAILSGLLGLPGLIDPAATLAFFGGEEPNYSFFVRLCSAFLLMTGWLSWETSRDLRAKAALMKYNWIAKAITAVIVTAGHLGGEAAPALMGLNVLTQWLWIPAILYCDIALRRKHSAVQPA